MQSKTSQSNGTSYGFSPSGLDYNGQPQNSVPVQRPQPAIYMDDRFPTLEKSIALVINALTKAGAILSVEHREILVHNIMAIAMIEQLRTEQEFKERYF